MPAFARIIDEGRRGLADASGVGLLEDTRPDLKGQDARNSGG